MLEELFAIFYVDDGYIASRDPDFLQRALDMMVNIFRRTHLETNTAKTQAMVCTPGKMGPVVTGLCWETCLSTCLSQSLL